MRQGDLAWLCCILRLYYKPWGKARSLAAYYRVYYRVYYRALNEVHCNVVHCNVVHLHLQCTQLLNSAGCVYYRALVHFEHLLSVLRALTLKNQNNSVHWKYPDDALQTVQKLSVRQWTLLALNGRHLGYVAEEEESSDRNTSWFVSRV